MPSLFVFSDRYHPREQLRSFIFLNTFDEFLATHFLFSITMTTHSDVNTKYKPACTKLTDALFSHFY